MLDSLKKREEDAQKFIRPQRRHADLIVAYRLNDPVDSLEVLLEKPSFEIKLEILVNANVDLQNLADSYVKITGKRADLSYIPEDDRVCVVFWGAPSAREVELIAGVTVRSYFELLDNFPVWQSGYVGLIQLILLIILDTSRSKRMLK